jgi:hypothetical protein
MSVGKTSRQQYRNGVSKPQQANCGTHASLCDSIAKTIQGVARATTFLIKKGKVLAGRIQMKRREYSRTTAIDPDSVIVNLISVDLDSSVSTCRAAEISEFATEVIRLASKRGRVKVPSSGGCDEAA